MVLKLTISYKTRRYSGGQKEWLLTMKVTDKEKFKKSPEAKGWQIESAISSMLFTQCIDERCYGLTFYFIYLIGKDKDNHF